MKPVPPAACLAALRAAAEDLETDPLLHDDYERWRRQASGSSPSSRTIVRRFGTWAEALDLAGLNSARAPYRPNGPHVDG